MPELATRQTLVLPAGTPLKLLCKIVDQHLAWQKITIGTGPEHISVQVSRTCVPCQKYARPAIHDNMQR